jgi:hypothetical protein
VMQGGNVGSMYGDDLVGDGVMWSVITSLRKWSDFWIGWGR